MTPVLLPGAEWKAGLIFRIPADFVPAKVRFHLSNLGDAPTDKRIQEVSLANCDFAATSEQFDVSKAPKPPMPKGAGGTNQQNGDAQGKAGAWVSDKYRRVFVTGIRGLDTYIRKKDNNEMHIGNKGEKLYVLTLMIQNITPGTKTNLGLGYVVSALAGADGTAVGDPQFDILQGAAGGLTRELANGESSAAALIFRTPADFVPKAAILQLSHLGKPPITRIVRISLENCDLNAISEQFKPTK
jgi:hypothetical protein